LARTITVLVADDVLAPEFTALVPPDAHVTD
jgi:hypothetical protein